MIEAGLEQGWSTVGTAVAAPTVLQPCSKGVPMVFQHRCVTGLGVHLGINKPHHKQEKGGI